MSMKNQLRVSAVLVTLCAVFLSTAPALARSGKDRTSLWLLSTGADSSATARAVFQEKGDRRAFRVEVRDLEIGPYELWVGGGIVGTINVKHDDGGLGETRGRIRFDSRKGNTLSFDPTGQSLSIRQGTTTFFEDRFPSSSSEIVDLEIEVDLVNTGVVLGASGEAKLRLRNGRTDFSVEIEDVPAGDYSLRVNGAVVATITAALRPGQTSIEGEVEFSTDMDEVGHQPLTFEPRGALIEVLQGSVPILSVTFPVTSPTL